MRKFTGGRGCATKRVVGYPELVFPHGNVRKCSLAVRVQATLNMGHEHGSEYQLKVVLLDGKEDCSGWLTQDELTVAMSAVPRKGSSCWLRVRKLVCVQCADGELGVSEVPLALSGSSRNLPHDSRYLRAAGVKNRSEVARPH